MCFFSSFSSFNDEKAEVEGRSITIIESQLKTMLMFNLMTKKKVNWTVPLTQTVVLIYLPVPSKVFLVHNRRYIRNLSDYIAIWTHNHLTPKHSLPCNVHCEQGVPWNSCNLKVLIYSIHVCDMINIHSQMHHADKLSQGSSNIWPVWLNDRMFV